MTTNRILVLVVLDLTNSLATKQLVTDVLLELEPVPARVEGAQILICCCRNSINWASIVGDIELTSDNCQEGN